MKGLLRFILYFLAAIAPIFILIGLVMSEKFTGNQTVLAAVFLVVILPVALMIGVAKRERKQNANNPNG